MFIRPIELASCVLGTNLCRDNNSTGEFIPLIVSYHFAAASHFNSSE